jgi:hypothetical protein
VINKVDPINSPELDHLRPRLKPLRAQPAHHHPNELLLAPAYTQRQHLVPS